MKTVEKLKIENATLRPERFEVLYEQGDDRLGVWAGPGYRSYAEAEAAVRGALKSSHGRNGVYRIARVTKEWAGPPIRNPA